MVQEIVTEVMIKKPVSHVWRETFRSRVVMEMFYQEIGEGLKVLFLKSWLFFQENLRREKSLGVKGRIQDIGRKRGKYFILPDGLMMKTR